MELFYLNLYSILSFIRTKGPGNYWPKPCCLDIKASAFQARWLKSGGRYTRKEELRQIKMATSSDVKSVKAKWQHQTRHWVNKTSQL